MNLLHTLDAELNASLESQKSLFFFAKSISQNDISCAFNIDYNIGIVRKMSHYKSARYFQQRLLVF